MMITFKMEATIKNDFIGPDFAVKIKVERNKKDSGNKDVGIILNKSDSVNYGDNIALGSLQTSIEETCIKKQSH